MQQTFLLSKSREYLHSDNDPTNAVLEERVASIGEGAAVVALSSGSSATAIAIQNLCSAGDNIIVCLLIYTVELGIYL